VSSTLFAFVVLLGVLIFVHELGHFLVAKACGVRVLKFSLGFGPPVGFGRFRLRFVRGGTEYVVAWFPLGGFVKMLGENPDEADDQEVHAHPGETLGAKPVWQKLAIVFAGPAMNLLLPVAIFAAMLTIGMDRPAPVIGMVEAGSPAERAGLRAGDRIVSLDGAPARWWDEVAEELRGSPGRALRVGVEREGWSAEVRLELAPHAELDEFGNVEHVGWVGIGHGRLRALLGIPDAGGPAYAAGLRSGDLVRAVAGEPVEDWEAFARALAAAGEQGGELAVRVDRSRGEGTETLELAIPRLGSAAALGVMPASVLVSAVTKDAPADRAGLQPGDLILTVDGAPVGSFTSFQDTVQTSGGRELVMRIAREGQVRELRIAPKLETVEVGLGIEEPRYLVGIRSPPTTLVGALAVDREWNPVVSIPRAVSRTVETTFAIVGGIGKFFTGEVSPRQIAGPIGIAQIAGQALEIGWEAYIQVMVFISINLGVLNLLPIPILDGGQAVLFSLEAIKRSPLSLRTREIFQQIGFMVLILLMGLAFWNDLSRHWSKMVDWLRQGAGL